MLLKSIKMLNFRQFKGKQNIEFSNDSQRNVTVILGNNTTGKTTLLQAFNWCLYGFADFESKDFLINKDVAFEMGVNDIENVEVELNLIHDNTEYYISRTQEYHCDSRGTHPSTVKTSKVSYKQEDGQIEPIKKIYVDNRINEILPKDLSNYFFFDTERISNISSKADVTAAVKGLLGLSVLDNTMRHLGNEKLKSSVIGKLNASMDLTGNERAAKALNLIQSEQLRKDGIAEQLLTVKKEIKYYEDRKEQLNGILRENEPTSKLQRKKEMIERDLNYELQSLNSSYAGLKKAFNSNTTNFFAQPLMKRAMNLLKEAKVDDKGIKDMNAQSIADIINRARCVCGTEIIEGNQAYNNLQKELEYLPPQSIGTIIRNFKEKIETYDSTNNTYFSSIDDKYRDIFRSKERITKWEDEVIEISSEIKGKENMQKSEEELLDVKKRLRDLNDKKERLIREDGSCSTEIERNQKIYDSLVAVSDKNKQVMTYIKYAEEIYNWIDYTYKDNESEIREKLEEKVNNIFSKMYHGQRKVIIDEKYKVSLLTTFAENEEKTDESKGLETVKNFAFIAGLVDLAKEKISDNSMVLSSEPYPLVMDAPYSNADEMHIVNISKVLPEIAEQVIIFVMEKDWKYAEEVMDKKTGRIYHLDKHSETLTYLKRSDV